MISSMALAHLYLRSYWGKILLILAAVPISMAKNGVRIFALSMLGMKVNPAFLYGRLHRNGGIVFFLLAMAGLPPSSKPYARAKSGRRQRYCRSWCSTYLRQKAGSSDSGVSHFIFRKSQRTSLWIAFARAGEP